MRRGLVWFGLVLLTPWVGHADTSYLKNGEQVEVGVAWR